MGFQQVVIHTQPGEDVLVTSFTGTDENDFVITVAPELSLSMGNGDDTVFSFGYRTYAIMGDGNDVALGGSAGYSSFLGGEGDDYLAVAGGDYNFLAGGNGADILIGGAGKDFLYFDANDLFVFGGGGSDRFMFDSYHNGGIVGIADFDGTSPQHDILDLSVFAVLTKDDLSLFEYNGGQLLYVDGSATDDRPAVAIVGVDFFSIDQALSSGALFLGPFGGQG